MLVPQPDEVHLLDLTLQEISEDLLLEFLFDGTHLLLLQQQIVELFNMEL